MLGLPKDQIFLHLELQKAAATHLGRGQPAKKIFMLRVGYSDASVCRSREEITLERVRLVDACSVLSF